MNNPLLNKLPPHNIDAEESVLSALFINNAGFEDERVEDLQPDHFYKPAHKKIFSAMCSLRKKNEPADLLTVAQALDRKEQLKEIGGASYLAKISDAAPVAVNVGHYAKIVKDHAITRAMITTGIEIVQDGYGNIEDIDSYVDRSQAKVLGIQPASSKDDIHDMGSIVMNGLDRIETVQTSDAEIGHKLGLPKLDVLIQLFGSILAIIAGRPGMGKTAFALSLALYLAKRSVKVGFLSLEMDKESLFDRLLSILSNINSLKFYRKNALTGEDFQALNKAAGILSELPIFIDDGQCDIHGIGRKCRKLKKMGCEIIFIDQLSKIKNLGPANRTKFEIYSDHCSAIAMLKKELRTPIFLLSQVNRELEKRHDKRPTLSDLKLTGSLEEDADLVFFLFRPGYYDKTISLSRTEIILAKNRQGATGVEYQLTFNFKRGMFELKNGLEG